MARRHLAGDSRPCHLLQRAAGDAHGASAVRRGRAFRFDHGDGIGEAHEEHSRLGRVVGAHEDEKEGMFRGVNRDDVILGAQEFRRSRWSRTFNL